MVIPFFNFKIFILKGSPGPFGEITSVQGKGYLVCRAWPFKSPTDLSSIRLDHEDHKNPPESNKLLVGPFKTHTPILAPLSTELAQAFDNTNTHVAWFT